jgi:hypothetical protein
MLKYFQKGGSMPCLYLPPDEQILAATPFSMSGEVTYSKWRPVSDQDVSILRYCLPPDKKWLA